MACLLVYEQANNTELDSKEEALDDFIQAADFALKSSNAESSREQDQQTRGRPNGLAAAPGKHEYSIRAAYPDLPEINMPAVGQ